MPIRLFFLLSIILGAPFLPPSFADEQPNVLFIAIDDQNDWIGCLDGHPDAKTPHIDALAKRGVLFTNAHCQAPLCNPSRTSLMTGLRPSTTGIYGLAPWFRNVPEWNDLTTLPQHFAANGYRTLTTGKIYHGGYGRKTKDREFDVIGPPPGVGVRPKQKLVNTPAKHPLVDWGVFPHNEEDKQDFKVASWAVEQIEADHKQPFFLSVGFFLPHVPCYPTQEYYDLYPEDTTDLPTVPGTDRDDTPRFSWYLHWSLPEPRLKFLKEANEWSNLVRSYLACTSFIDAQIGRLTAALERSGKADNTIIVLWSDHGWHLGEKLITGKNTLWEPSTRVPLIFAGPKIGSGVCVEPAELLDIYPTLNDLCDLPTLDHLEGLSLVPQLRDPSISRSQPAITTHNRGNHGIRDRDHRYIRYADGSEEFYDLTIDPEELTNRIDDAKYSDVIQTLRSHLPKIDRPAVPGSRSRILKMTDDGPIWEGKPIGENDPIPEL